jgi:hypothetical protein
MSDNELNAKMAELMGWHWDDDWGCLIPPEQFFKPSEMWTEWKFDDDDEGALYREPVKGAMVSGISYNGDSSKIILPDYQGDIAAAMQVFEWLRDRYFSLKIIVWDHTDKVAIVGHKRQGHNENLGDLEVEANTLPLAICLAARMAVEVG